MNIRILIAALAISAATFAQETENKNPETEQESNGPGKNVGSITIGPYFPIAFGDNFVNNGMDLKLGARLSFKVDTYKGIYIGPYFSFFNGEVTNPELLGNYYNTTNFVIGAIVGFEKHINKFDINIGIGVGASSYENDGPFDNFGDTATAVWLNPEVSYRITTYLGVYVAPEIRHDFMNIDVPSELEDTFKGVNYLNISFGLRINLGTAYKYL
ncbi:hypothetical protein [Aequorivita sp. CIP111184]|uniref:hypothetical protein n=1 Tax=Aequorivita sp. CIP111184 TaxID=2211356 RepID=UPI0011BFAB3A|nr:hypothetical protein [Aequorivita sp. CIP111184]